MTRHVRPILLHFCHWARTWVLYNNWGYFHILEISSACKIQSSWRPIQLPEGQQQEVSGVLSSTFKTPINKYISISFVIYDQNL